jgi:diguanylate cyclase (GGDEF)-like protein
MAETRAIDGVGAELRAWLEALRLALGAQCARLWMRAGADRLQVALVTPEGEASRPTEVPLRGHALGWVVSEGVALRASRGDIFRGSAAGWLVAVPVVDTSGERVGCVALDFDETPRPEATRVLELAASVGGRLLSSVRADEQKAREQEKDRALYGTVKDLDRQLDLKELANGLCRRAVSVSGARGAVAATWDAGEGTGRIIAVGGGAARMLVGAHLDGGASFLGLALLNATPLPQDDLRVSSNFPLYVQGIDARAGSAIIMPMISGIEPVGALVVEYARARGFSEGDVERLHMLATFVAPAFRNALTFGEVKAMSMTDALTGLPNRRSAERALASAVTVAERTGGPFAVAVLDIDHFKRFNDRFGHDAGDLVLRAVGEVIRDRLRPGDHAGRWGGEEFLIVLPGAALEDAARVLERIRRSVESLEVDWGGETLRVTLSAGLSAFPKVTRSPTTVVSAADAALYKAKRGGRNAVALADSRRR